MSPSKLRFRVACAGALAGIGGALVMVAVLRLVSLAAARFGESLFAALLVAGLLCGGGLGAMVAFRTRAQSVFIAIAMCFIAGPFTGFAMDLLFLVSPPPHRRDPLMMTVLGLFGAVVTSPALLAIGMAVGFALHAYSERLVMAARTSMSDVAATFE